ncbi:MSHA biogenesis protein MshK [Gammaproteobacteria bacterium]
MQKIPIRINLFFGVLIAISSCTLSPISFALRDPTRPVLAEYGNDSGDPVVKMIKLSSGQAVANINGKMVKVGDEINEMKVVAIERDAVLLRTSDNTLISIPICHSVVEKSTSKNHENKK